jgi:hypothetical protein
MSEMDKTKVNSLYIFYHLSKIDLLEATKYRNFLVNLLNYFIKYLNKLSLNIH